MALNFAFTFRVARAMVKSGLAQAKVYSSGSQDHSFVSLAETLSKDKASLGDEAESITPKAITTFIGGIITFSEQYCGRSVRFILFPPNPSHPSQTKRQCRREREREKESIE